MCLLIFAHQMHPEYPLVIAANRDEFHARPTAASHFWPEHPELLAGKDLDQGGTWMGVTSGGRFAAITNYRDPSRTAPAPRSRGEIPLAYLSGEQNPRDFLDDLGDRAGEYAGFNLLLGDGRTLWYLTNSLPPANRRAQCLEPGLYGLSNARLDTPWPKVELGKRRLRALLEDGEPDHEILLGVVSDQHLANPRELHRQGMDSGMEQLLSAQFIVTEAYGTRSSTSFWIESSGQGHWREQSYSAAGELQGVVQEHFSCG
jgi:uncharacterized protein with NRDE domain